MSKFDEGLELVDEVDFTPTTTRALIEHLAVQKESKSRQKAAIIGWLQDHTPSPLLEHSLRLNGYSSLLDPRASA